MTCVYVCASGKIQLTGHYLKEAAAEWSCMPPMLLMALLTASTTLFCVTQLSALLIAGGRASFQMHWCFLSWWCLLQMWRYMYVKSLTSTTGTCGVYCMRRQAYCSMFSLLPCKHPVSDTSYQLSRLSNNLAPSPGLTMAMLYAVQVVFLAV